MGGLRGDNRRPIVHGMIATLVFYTVLLAWQVPAMALASMLAPELTGQTTILCTASGPRIVAVDADGKPVENSHLPDPAKSCPICQGVAGAVTPLVSDAPELRVSAICQTVVFSPYDDRGEGHHALQRRGHDPPIRT